MLKVLVADEDVEECLDCCQFLSSNKNLDLIGVNTGITTLKKYRDITPNILVINSNFKDLNYIDIINELSNTSHERQNSNIILTVENNSKIELEYAAKLYKLFYFPIDYKKIKEGIEQYSLDKYIFYEPNEENLTALFYKLNLYNDFLGADYFKFAIKECYKNKNLLRSLKDLYNIISEEFNVSYNSIRPAMRYALISVNNYRKLNWNKGIFKLFENEDEITPKNFIRNITIHYLKHNRVENK